MYAVRMINGGKIRDLSLNELKMESLNNTALHLASLHHHFTITSLRITSPSLPLFVCLFTLCGRVYSTIQLFKA